jgi:hypothetical protein
MCLRHLDLTIVHALRILSIVQRVAISLNVTNCTHVSFPIWLLTVKYKIQDKIRDTNSTVYS